MCFEELKVATVVGNLISDLGTVITSSDQLASASHDVQVFLLAGWLPCSHQDFGFGVGFGSGVKIVFGSRFSRPYTCLLHRWA
jgi:hypothetical protein